jgi:hypothetical protein
MYFYGGKSALLDRNANARRYRGREGIAAVLQFVVGVCPFVVGRLCAGSIALSGQSLGLNSWYALSIVSPAWL